MRLYQWFGNVLVVLLVVGLCAAITGCKTPSTATGPGVEKGDGKDGKKDDDGDKRDKRGEVKRRWQDPALKTIYFDYDKSNIRSDQEAALANNLEWIKNHADLEVELVGHCDERGTNEYNLALGERRSDSVYKALVAGGIPAGKLYPSSLGEEEPVDPGHNEEAWSKNRRVEFWLIER